MLFTLNLYSVLCPLYLNESGKKEKKENWSAEEIEAVQEVVGNLSSSTVVEILPLSHMMC